MAKQLDIEKVAARLHLSKAQINKVYNHIRHMNKYELNKIAKKMASVNQADAQKIFGKHISNKHIAMLDKNQMAHTEGEFWGWFFRILFLMLLTTTRTK